jgi:hypothetical protein
MTKNDVTAQSMLSPEDAQRLTVPLAIYISKDEPVAEVNVSFNDA